MKTIIISTVLIFVLSTPLFSALLTDDLNVIIPTGNPISSQCCEISAQFCLTTPGMTLSIIRTPVDAIFIREYSKPWVITSVQLVNNMKMSDHLPFISHHKYFRQNKNNLNINIALE